MYITMKTPNDNWLERDLISRFFILTTIINAKVTLSLCLAFT